MGLLRWLLAGLAGYKFYQLTTNIARDRFAADEKIASFDGLSAIFRTREDADLAVEHLVQEYGIEPSFIYVDAANDENTAGVQTSGGDHAAAKPGHGERPDAPLNGAIELTVPVDQASHSTLERVLREAGAIEVTVF